MARVRVARNDGELGTVDESELQTMIDSGFRVVDDAEAQQVKRRRDAATVGSMAVGTVEAGARGLTLGASDVALRALGADMEAAAARKENLGTFGTVAEIAGAAAPSLLTGGTGAAATAARLTPAGLSARLGGAVARGAEAGTGSRVLGAAAQGGVEGLLGGMGTAASESALGDQDLAAERILAGGVQGMGVGVLLGGSFGYGAKGADLALDASGRLGRAALEGLGGIPRGADDTLASLAGKGEGRLERAARFLGRNMGGNEDAYARTATRLRTREGRDLILGDLQAARADSAKVIKGSIDTANQAVDDAVRLSNGAHKLRRVDAGLDGLDGATALPRAMEHLRGQQAQIKAIRDEFGDLIPAELKGDLAKFERFHLRAVDDIAKARDPAKAFMSIDRLKKSMQQVRRDREAHAKRVGSPELRETVQRLKTLESNAIHHLEDQAVWGKAGAVQRDVNQAASLEYRALDELKNKSPALRKMLEKGSVADEATALMLARYASKTGGASKVSALDEALDARLNYLRTVKRYYDLPEEAAKKIDDAERSVREMREQLAKQSEVAEASADNAALRADEGGGSPSLSLLTTAGSTVGGAVGFALGGVPGALLGGAAGYITRPFTTAKTAASLLNTFGRVRFGLDDVAAREAGVVAGFAKLAEGGRAAARAASRAARPVATRAAVMGTAPPESKAQRQSRLLAARDAVLAASADPVTVADKMEQAVADLHHFAPNVARQIVERSTVAALFLASKVPGVYEPEFKPGVRVVDPAALDKWERYVSAVSDPYGAVEKISRGVFDMEAAETLRVVYPKIFGELQAGVLQLLGERKAAGKRTSEEALIGLGLMLDMPLTDSLKPGFLSSLQTPPAPPPQPGAPPPAPSKPKGIEVVGRRTDIGRLEAGQLRS